MKINEYNDNIVNNIVTYSGDAICLITEGSEGCGYSTSSVIKRIKFGDKSSNQEVIFRAGISLTDISVSSSGILWAIDILGNVYCSVVSLSDYEQGYFDLSKWTTKGVVDGIPVCITCVGDSVYIATYEGEIVKYDGCDFTVNNGFRNPVRFKEVNGVQYLMGHNRRLMMLTDIGWQDLKFSDDIPNYTTINDLTYSDGHLYAVSILGVIMIETDGVFKILIDGTDVKWFSCDVINDEIYIAGGDMGAYKLSGGSLTLIKSGSFYLVYVVSIGNNLAFLNSQSSDSSFIMHKPNDNRWLIITS